MGNNTVLYLGVGDEVYDAFNTLRDLLHNSTLAISPIEIAVQGRGLALTNIDVIVQERVQHALPISKKDC